MPALWQWSSVAVPVSLARTAAEQEAKTSRSALCVSLLFKRSHFFTQVVGSSQGLPKVLRFLDWLLAVDFTIAMFVAYPC